MKVVTHNKELAVEFSGGEIHRAIQFAQAIRTVKLSWCDGRVVGVAHERPERGTPRAEVHFEGRIIDAVQWGYIRTLSIKGRIGSRSSDQDVVTAGGANAVLERLALSRILFLCSDVESDASLADRLHWDDGGQSFDALEFHPVKGGDGAYLTYIRDSIQKLLVPANTTEQLSAFLQSAACRLSHLPLIGATYDGLKVEIMDLFSKAIDGNEDPIVNMFFAEAMYYWVEFLRIQGADRLLSKLFGQLKSLIGNRDPHIRLAAIVSAAKYPEVRKDAWSALLNEAHRRHSSTFGRYLADTCLELYNSYSDDVDNDTPRLALALSMIRAGDTGTDVIHKLYLNLKGAAGVPAGRALEDAFYVFCASYFDPGCVRSQHSVRRPSRRRATERPDLFATIELEDHRLGFGPSVYRFRHTVGVVFECKDWSTKVKPEKFAQLERYASPSLLGVDRVLVLLIAPGGIADDLRKTIAIASEAGDSWTKRFYCIEGDEVAQLLKGQMDFTALLRDQLRPHLLHYNG